MPKVTEQVRDLKPRPPRVPDQISDYQDSLRIPQRELVWSPLGKGPRTGMVLGYQSW